MARKAATKARGSRKPKKFSTTVGSKFNYTQRSLTALVNLTWWKPATHFVHVSTLEAQVRRTAEEDGDILGPHLRLCLRRIRDTLLEGEIIKIGESRASIRFSDKAQNILTGLMRSHGDLTLRTPYQRKWFWRDFEEHWSCLNLHSTNAQKTSGVVTTTRKRKAADEDAYTMPAKRAKIHDVEAGEAGPSQVTNFDISLPLQAAAPSSLQAWTRFAGLFKGFFSYPSGGAGAPRGGRSEAVDEGQANDSSSGDTTLNMDVEPTSSVEEKTDLEGPMLAPPGGNIEQAEPQSNDAEVKIAALKKEVQLFKLRVLALECAQKVTRTERDALKRTVAETLKGLEDVEGRLKNSDNRVVDLEKEVERLKLEAKNDFRRAMEAVMKTVDDQMDMQGISRD